MGEMVGFRIELYPTPEQIKIFNENFGVATFIYNKMRELSYDEDDMCNCMTFVDMTNAITSLKNQEEYAWLNDYNVDMLRTSARELFYANKRFLMKINRRPKFRKKTSGRRHFGVRADRLKIFDNQIMVSEGKKKLGPIKCAPHYDFLTGNSWNAVKKGTIRNREVAYPELPYKKYRDARIVVDGGRYYLTFCMDKNVESGIVTSSMKKFILDDEWNEKETTDVIGIDLGCKQNNWAVASNGMRLSKPDTSKEDKKIAKLTKDIQRKKKVNDRIYNEKMKIANSSNGNETPPKREASKNEIEAKKELTKYYNRRRDKRINSINCFSNCVIEAKPEAIVMEDLNVMGMLIHDDTKICEKQKNNINKTILSSYLYAFRTIVQQKAENNGILFILAPQTYPSTQLCSNCGHIQDIHRRKIYRCPVCGMVMDRDENAATNLQHYGEDYLANFA